MKVNVLKMLSYAAVIVCLTIVSTGVASAQTDVFWVNYFSNNLAPAPAPTATVRIDNPGLTYGTLCAMIYVFDNDQQLTECCGCQETHNGLRTLSVRTDLTRNPLTGVISDNGVIKVVSAAVNGSNYPYFPYGCDPTANVSPKANLRVWVTHIQNASALGTFGGTVWPTTETESSASALGATELANLQAQCSFINILGSGHGECSCGTGD
jgi:hypothetical protein